jgi:ribosomal protein S18 acetylase RimI-like enzyme
LQKLLLSVFAHNEAALRFYRKLGFREGWTTADPRGSHIGAARDAYYSVCPACFDELRAVVVDHGVR